jgi:formate-dependent nitrite reductase membrane component NrfD
MQTVRFLLFVAVVMVVSGVIALNIHTGTADWHSFKVWMTWIKWIVVPLMIVLIPRFYRFMIQKELTKSQRRLLMHSQVIMACLFVAVEAANGGFQ